MVLAGCTELQLGPPYPGRIAAPEVVGVISSVVTGPDGNSSTLILGSGEELWKRHGERSIPGAPGPGDLVWFGTQPDRWFLVATFNNDLDCYTFSADRAFSEPDAVVLAFAQWSGVGIRLPKAPGFDDSRLVTRNSDGRLEYSGWIVGFCADGEGRVSGD